MPVCLDGFAAGGSEITAFLNGEVRQGLRSKPTCCAPSTPAARRRCDWCCRAIIGIHGDIHRKSIAFARLPRPAARRCKHRIERGPIRWGRSIIRLTRCHSCRCINPGRAQVLAALKKEKGTVSEADAIAALHEFSALWARLFPVEQARIIQLLVRRVTVTAAGLEVDIRREGIAGVIREMVAPRRMEAAE